MDGARWRKIRNWLGPISWKNVFTITGILSVALSAQAIYLWKEFEERLEQENGEAMEWTRQRCLEDLRDLESHWKAIKKEPQESLNASRNSPESLAPKIKKKNLRRPGHADSIQ